MSPYDDDSWDWLDGPWQPKLIDRIWRFVRTYPWLSMAIVLLLLFGTPYGCGVITGAML
jgi:hypothetical protein